MKAVHLITLHVIVLSLALPAGAGSIWAKRHRGVNDPFVDDVARQIGDVLTVKISEGSKIDNKSKRDMQKDTDRSAAFDGELDIASIQSFNMSAESSQQHKSKADFKDERKYIDSITVVVMDVLPNHNLVVAGTRDRIIAGDIQLIEVSGIVRPSDIAYDNSVMSELVANFRLETKNKGIAAPYNRPGWLGRVMDVLWPF
ncbi:flagellar basal body L-ring protein FlgH [Planctomycetota bacterium]